VVESFGFFKSQQVQALFLLFFKHFKPIFGEILVDGYLSGMGLSEKINHTLPVKFRHKQPLNTCTRSRQNYLEVQMATQQQTLQPSKNNHS